MAATLVRARAVGLTWGHEHPTKLRSSPAALLQPTLPRGPRMTWDDGKQYLEEMAPGVYAFVQPDGGWMVNNCGVITDASGDAVIVDTTSTEKRNRAFLAEVAGISARG